MSFMVPSLVSLLHAGAYPRRRAGNRSAVSEIFCSKEGMAEVDEETVVGERSITVSIEVDVSAGGSRVEGVVPSQLSAQTHGEDQWKSVLMAGFSISLVSLVGIFLYPPITTKVGKPHGFMSHTLHFLAFVSLGIGVLLMLLSALLYRYPRLINTANSLIQIGWGLLSMTFGYGSA